MFQNSINAQETAPTTIIFIISHNFKYQEFGKGLLSDSSAPSGINRGHLVVFSWQMVQRVLESFIMCMVPWEHLRALIRDPTHGFYSTTFSALSNFLRGSTGLQKEFFKEASVAASSFLPRLRSLRTSIPPSAGFYWSLRAAQIQKEENQNTSLYEKKSKEFVTIINLPHPVKSSHLYRILLHNWANLAMSNYGFST